MNKTFILLPLLALAACGNQPDETKKVEDTTPAQQVEAQSPFDGKNVTFTVDGKPVTLLGGASDTPMENSSAKISTRYVGYDTTGDLNGDGLQDHAFVVTHSTGGSGTFYYVVAAMKNADGYKTTNAFFIGDRIKPESLQIRSDRKELHVNFLALKQGEPMSSQPTEPKVLLLKVTPNGVLEGLMK